jgi:hypothetical protein
MQEVMGEHMSSSWSLLAGRTTCEHFADYWHKQSPDPLPLQDYGCFLPEDPFTLPSDNTRP